jgi:hypothetical protein
MYKETIIGFGGIALQISGSTHKAVNYTAPETSPATQVDTLVLRESLSSQAQDDEALLVKIDNSTLAAATPAKVGRNVDTLA